MWILAIFIGSLLAQPALGQGLPDCEPGGPYFGQVGELIQFDGTGSSSPGGQIVLYEWDFGDGGTAQGPTPQHVYGNAGSYTVRLRVTDNKGAFSNCLITAEIGPVAVEPLTWGLIKAHYRIARHRAPSEDRARRQEAAGRMF
jgi:PKD domain